MNELATGKLPPTEQRHPLSTLLDQMPTLAMVRLMNQLDATVPLVIAEVLASDCAGG